MNTGFRTPQGLPGQHSRPTVSSAKLMGLAGVEIWCLQRSSKGREDYPATSRGEGLSENLRLR